MSDRTRRWLPCVASVWLALAAAFPAVTAAQDTLAYRQRAESIAVELKAVRAERDSVLAEWRNRARAAESPPDSGYVVLFVGPIRLRTDSIVLDLARATATSAYRSLRETFGSAVDDRDDIAWALTAVLDTSAARLYSWSAMTISWSVGSENAGQRRIPRETGASNRRQLEQRWFESVSTSLRMSMGSAREWLGRSLGSRSSEDELRASVFRNLVVATAPLGRNCISGDYASCAAGLEIDSLAAGGDAFSDATKATLLTVALDLGGPEAYVRFIADSTADVRSRLERASGVVADSLLRTWRSEMLDARPAPASTPVRTALAAIVWWTLLGGISLRSSRWR